MLVEELEEGGEVWGVQEGDLHRPSGLHLSSIIHDRCKGVDPKRYDRGGPPDVAKMETGSAVEAALERKLAKYSPGGFRPPPMQQDGIWCSPDWITAQGILEEFKCTWYSMRKECPTHDVYWPWRTQIKGYCYVLQVLEAILRVLFINGTYAPPTPVFKSYRLIFTPGELKESWGQNVGHAKWRGWL